MLDGRVMGGTKGRFSLYGKQDTRALYAAQRMEHAWVEQGNLPWANDKILCKGLDMQVPFYHLENFKIMVDMRLTVSQVYQEKINIAYFGMGYLLIFFYLLLSAH